MNTITRLRDTSALLRSAGWSVREGATHSLGAVDLAAQRTWTRGEFEAVLHLLIVIDESEGELSFSEERGKSEHAPLTFSLGDDDPAHRRALGKELFDQLHALAYPREQSITAAAHVDASPARTRASFFRSTGNSEAFTRAFAALDGVHDDLLQHSMEMIADDLELLSEKDALASIAPFARRCDLLHGIVITDQTMATPSVRLERTRVVGAEYRWIDIVRSDAFPAFADALTRHYTGRFRKRRFT